jgi:hypothetical protein
MPKMPTYLTRSGSRYSIDGKKRMMRNGELFCDEEGNVFTYNGVANHAYAREMVNDDAISVTRGSWPISHLLYVIDAENRLGTKDIPFEKVQKHMSEGISLEFVNRRIEKLILTTPIVGVE